MARRIRREIVEDDRPVATERTVVRRTTAAPMNPIAIGLAVLIGLFLLWLIVTLL